MALIPQALPKNSVNSSTIPLIFMKKLEKLRSFISRHTFMQNTHRNNS